MFKKHLRFAPFLKLPPVLWSSSTDNPNNLCLSRTQTPVLVSITHEIPALKNSVSISLYSVASKSPKKELFILPMMILSMMKNSRSWRL